ncbi:hypothetical protein IWQ62_000113 [Dispira parvispora]|uniref:Myb-like, SWIRM and MPN domain-containing protein 1 n=1 Tax=Dispira parvispora TaxID=1520584 RepID=A0A9W8E5E2_9FUNG|nr:hypothetical protein IWQ62_000113 [Dispira parvispora]
MTSPPCANSNDGALPHASVTNPHILAESTTTASEEPVSELPDDAFAIPEWDAIKGENWKDADAATRAIIETMLEEEAYYMAPSSSRRKRDRPTYESGTSGDTAGKNRTEWPSDTVRKVHRSKSQTNCPIDSEPHIPAISSTHLPSRRPRWTEEEDQVLVHGIRVHGLGQWRAIADHMQTRSPSQVKTRARYLLMCNRLVIAKDSSSTQLVPATVTMYHSTPASATVGASSTKVDQIDVTTTNSTDEEIDIEDVSDEIDSPGLSPIDVKPTPLPTSPPGEPTITKPIVMVTSPELSPSNTKINTPPSGIKSQSLSPTPSDQSSDLSSLPSSPNAFEPPSFDPNYISEAEKLAVPEFFTGKYNKSPDRYLKIRNYILDVWKSRQPKYVTKTAVRPGLRDCGDVNAISRVHSYLEQVGAINRNAIIPAAVYGKLMAAKSAGKNSTKVKKAKPSVQTGINLTRTTSQLDLVPRQRLDRQVKGVNVALSPGANHEDEVDLHTRSHTSTISKTVAPQSPNSPTGYDPFTLVAPLHETDVTAPVSQVTVDISALIVMDFHSHLADTEIIGLFGGKIDETERTIRIEQAFPCRSASTDFQCEMDPTSEMEARTHFAKAGLSVVGWYHSHPTFDPNPSIRDIENQSSYQGLFRRQDGWEPFVGAIVCPFYARCTRTSLFASDVQFFSLGYRMDTLLQNRLPIYCTFIAAEGQVPFSLLFQQLVELVTQYRHHPHRCDLLAGYPNFSRDSKLTKLLRACTHHLRHTPGSEKWLFLQQVSDLVIGGFGLPREEVDEWLRENQNERESIIRIFRQHLEPTSSSSPKGLLLDKGGSVVQPSDSADEEMVSIED